MRERQQTEQSTPQETEWTDQREHKFKINLINIHQLNEYIFETAERKNSKDELTSKMNRRKHHTNEQ